MIQQARKLLKNVFGYDQFISLQEQIIISILQQRDTLAIMPTGGGKSLCYQIPALMLPGVTLVISPLISLMQDQVDQLREAGVAAVLLNSSLNQETYRANLHQVKNGTAKLLYIAPEAFQKNQIRELFSSISISCLAIDEAHCISQWGHDFRPEYRQIAAFRSHCHAPCIALTATATPRVRQDIKESLLFKNSSEFVASFDRTNLLLKVEPKFNALEQTLNCIRRFKGQAGIIYCTTRNQVDDMAMALKGAGISAEPYHAGMDNFQRSHNQQLFARDDIEIIVATVAFGMGINKSNIRFVIHFSIPKNIESYYQEIGRAGRDGLPSECLLLFAPKDLYKIRFLFNSKNDQEKEIAHRHLNEMVLYAEALSCRRLPLLHYFGEKYTHETCNMCDNCLKEEMETVDISIAAQKFLSCVKRTGEMFGPAHIIKVLHGSRAKKVLSFGHDQLSTYGIGKEYSQEQWNYMSRVFLHQELMIRDPEYGSLKLTPKTWDLFKGKVKVSAHAEALGLSMNPVHQKTAYEDGKSSVTLSASMGHGTVAPQGAKTSSNTTHAPPRNSHDTVLFGLLRQKRKEMADESGVPPYVIFSDKTLVELATFFPHSQESFLAIHGIGEIKLEKFGTIFLDMIKDYCRENNIHEVPRPGLKPFTSRRSNPYT